MFAALAKAFAQISDPAFRRVFLVSLATSLVVFALLWALAWWSLAWVGEGLLAWATGEGAGGIWARAIEWAFGAASVLAVLVTSFFLFPAVMVSVMSLFLEEIAAAVERRHYPGLVPPRGQPLHEALRGALVFAGISIALNLLFAPLYLLLMFVPPFNLFVFYLLNGYLFGLEYFELVAARRLAPEEMKRLHRAHRGRVLSAGVVIAFLLTLPLVNLAMPLVATGFMVHVFEGVRRRAGAPGAVPGQETR
ncbi:MAG: EI24 domain-containing protein [Kiloniellaceae bacterium]